MKKEILEKAKLIRDNFCEELTLSQFDKQKTLPFLKTEFTTYKNKNNFIQVLVIGGTNCVNGIFERNTNGEPHLVSIENCIVPFFKDSKVFFDFISSKLDENISLCVLNIAQALKEYIRDEKIDGILLNSSKEHIFNGLIDKSLGEALEKHIKNIGKNCDFLVVNDMTSLTRLSLSNEDWDEVASLIVGTGYNMGLYSNNNIIVNTEACEFSLFPQTNEGIIIDKTIQTGLGIFEKEVSGGFLYRHFNLIAEKNKIKIRLNSTEELDLLARNQEETEEVILARYLIERSAGFIAGQIAGLLQNRKKNMKILVEGSLFWKCYDYQHYIENYLKELSPYNAYFWSKENSSLFGAIAFCS